MLQLLYLCVCGEMFTNAMLRLRFMKQFLVEEKQIEDPIVSPYNRPSFTGLPPALFIIAELDPLRDDGLGKYNHGNDDINWG